MGGRGQSTRRTGITTPAAPAPATPAENNVTELAKNPQDPLTFDSLYDEDDNVINPHFRQEKQYNINCQTCVLAAELNARGIYVEATGNTSGNRGKHDYEAYDESWYNLIPDGFRESFADTFERNTQGDMFFGPKVAYTKLQKAILADMSDGQRGVLRVFRWGSGHVANFEVQNGKVTVFDNQTGARMNLKTFLYGEERTEKRNGEKVQVAKKRWEVASFARIDDIPIITDSDLAREYFKPRSKK